MCGNPRDHEFRRGSFDAVFLRHCPVWTDGDRKAEEGPSRLFLPHKYHSLLIYQSILIHSDCDALGLAAVQVASLIGAEVIPSIALLIS
jgi:hypothetical protein